MTRGRKGADGIRRGARVAAALAIAALAPGPARADPLSDAERGAGGVEDLLRSVEEALHRPQATPHDVAAQRFSSGETQYLLGDWPHAAPVVEFRTRARNW